MVSITWTTTQKQRLMELGAVQELATRTFGDAADRDQSFQRIESELAGANKQALMAHKGQGSRPVLNELGDKLIDCLRRQGFSQVNTPIIIAKSTLEKMTITDDSPLAEQVFWVDHNKCLRPMLAPNLYSVMKDLYRQWGDPVRIFEIGSCFRKESQGKYHLNEFTMLNLVEMGVADGQQENRLRALISMVMKAVGMTNYEVEKSSSEVYGETIDVVCGDLELSSGAYGPHSLDNLWGVFTPWVGLGIGVERLAMALEGHRNIKRVGRSLSYWNGFRLNI